MEANQTHAREKFGSKIGFILAAAGSAVGLGNIWRFPYLAAKYGGGFFLLIYLILAVTFGFALMLTEIAIGRKTGSSVIGAYGKINKKFDFLGIGAAAVPIILTPYYCVIGGWVLKYLAAFITEPAATVTDGYFGNFIGTTGDVVPFFLIFIALTAVAVFFGVQKGIEKVSKIMMPALVVLILGVAVYVATLPGAGEGLAYYFKPDFEGMTFEKLMKTIVAAMGQMFYSMSLAMGIMITYGSYMRKEDSIEKGVRQIEIFDTGVAFIAGAIIVPAVFIFSGGDANALQSGPSLMFTTLPKVFMDPERGMAGGGIIGIVFFVLVALAALTSSISLMETIVSILMERFRLKRITACIITTGILVALGMLSVLGYSAWQDFTLLDMQMLDFFDFLTNNIMMPIVAFITCILIGRIAGTKVIEDEVLHGQTRFGMKKLYRIMIRIVCPIFMILILLTPILFKNI